MQNTKLPEMWRMIGHGSAKARGFSGSTEGPPASSTSLTRPPNAGIDEKTKIKINVDHSRLVSAFISDPLDWHEGYTNIYSRHPISIARVSLNGRPLTLWSSPTSSIHVYLQWRDLDFIYSFLIYKLPNFAYVIFIFV